MSQEVSIQLTQQQRQNENQLDSLFFDKSSTTYHPYTPVYKIPEDRIFKYFTTQF